MNNLLDYIISVDKELLIFLNNLGSDYWDGLWLFLTNKYTSTFFYLLLLVLFFKHFGIKKSLLLFFLAILLITVSDQLANLFKNGFERLRPCQEESVRYLIRTVKEGCGWKFGYYSAHASTGMALAVFLGFSFQSVYKKVKYYLLIFAFLVGYSRIYLGVHYPVDVLSGFLIGALIGFLFYHLYFFCSVKYIR